MCKPCSMADFRSPLECACTHTHSLFIHSQTHGKFMKFLCWIEVEVPQLSAAAKKPNINLPIFSPWQREAKRESERKTSERRARILNGSTVLGRLLRFFVWLRSVYTGTQTMQIVVYANSLSSDENFHIYLMCLVHGLIHTPPKRLSHTHRRRCNLRIFGRLRGEWQ